MKCNGSRWHVQSKTQRLEGAGRGLGLGSASAPTEDEIPAHRRSDILQIRSFEPSLGSDLVFVSHSCVAVRHIRY